MTSWLHRYGNKQHQWRDISTLDDRIVYERQLGLVEASFDVDGVHYGGRADMTHYFEFEIRTSLDRDALQGRIALAWTVLRTHHLLLASRAEDRKTAGTQQRCFVVDIAKDARMAIEDAKKFLTIVPGNTAIDQHDFRRHALNTARIIEPEKSLSRLFVLPITQLSNDRYNLPFMIVLAHMISDGLSLFHALGHFVDLMNRSASELQELLASILTKDAILSRLPPAQEDLYPPVAGNKARQRWFWAIIRILRHVRKPLPAGFTNPLRREERTYFTLPPKYSPTFDYAPEKHPPMNSGSITPTLSVAASKRLATLCRSAGTSVGAGVFALVALTMSELYEEYYPAILLEDRKPFIASFPLNPRPFFNYIGPADSCMLAFSDGIIMPFLPASLPLEGRLRLLAKSAHRQLRQYQKRKKSGAEALDSHSPRRMVATNYLSAVERAEEKLPVQYRNGVNPQGAYPANVTFGAATCGVSSVGLVKDVAPGKYDLDGVILGVEGRDLAADFRELRGGVRARDNEFLCGNSADAEGRLSYSVSYDASAMDEEKVLEWQRRIERVLEMGGSRL